MHLSGSIVCQKQFGGLHAWLYNDLVLSLFNSSPPASASEAIISYIFFGLDRRLISPPEEIDHPWDRQHDSRGLRREQKSCFDSGNLKIIERYWKSICWTYILQVFISSNMFKPYRASNTSCWGKFFSHRLTLQDSSGDMPVSQPLRCGSGRCEPCVDRTPFAGPSQTIGDLPVLTVEYCVWLARVFYLFLCQTHIWYKIHTTVRMHHYVALQVCDLEEHVGIYCTVDRATHSLRTCLLWNMACSWMKLTLSVRRRHIAAMDNGSQS